MLRDHVGVVTGGPGWDLVSSPNRNVGLIAVYTTVTFAPGIWVYLMRTVWYLQYTVTVNLAVCSLLTLAAGIRV
jgi:hypothetical protein